ncbi:hypothetical protein PVK06_039902 [Gossypium arboreum]|uniref:Uncharacterized protein n=1 Tax=Gossypium arboreum TaxID=29729 RepID=A0ABR0N434_GOSAR|nr:hypothetical protein PVK06_039902 [Gossypium arboreum]
MDLLNHILCSSSWLRFPSLLSSEFLGALLPVFFSGLSPTNLNTLTLKSPLVSNNNRLNLQRSFFHPKSQKIASSALRSYRMRRSIGFSHKNDSLEACILFSHCRISNVVDRSPRWLLISDCRVLLRGMDSISLTCFYGKSPLKVSSFQNTLSVPYASPGKRRVSR